MQIPTLAASVGGIVLLGTAALWSSDPVLAAPDEQANDKTQLVQAFLGSHPGAAISEFGERISRVYGRAFSHGETAEHSAEQFRLNEARMFGVPPQDLVKIGPFADGRHVQPIMYDPGTGQYTFSGHYYTQVRDGIPVFRAQLTLLVRNEPGYPLVLASSNLRDLGDFRVNEGAVKRFDPNQVLAPADAQIGVGAQVQESNLVIWAGVDDLDAAPRLAQRLILFDGPALWLVLRDAETSAILYEENLICTVDIVGNVSGRATEGVGAEQCEEEVPMPLPYVPVTNGVTTAFTDVNGDFVIPNPGSSPITVSASLMGQWFDVFNALGAETTESVVVTPPGPANLLFNSANTDEFVRAQVNGYVYSNLIRDYVLQFHPTYPTLDDGGFPVTVNRTDGVCPGNAWYSSSGGGSINFCRSGGGYPNTAWSSVIYHEYGHHLVAVAGSGQGAYGEGMGDTMSTLILDDPRLGFGFFGDCSSSLRNADNTMQYPCNGAIHTCGQLISGCVWSTRNELAITNPSTFGDIIGNLTVNSIVMHTGSNITPDITIDFLVLDDDDGDILNGTPHYNEIDAGFSAHNMDAPELSLLSFAFPGGLPEMIDPAGGTTVHVLVQGVSADPQPDTGLLHIDAGGGFVTFPMMQAEPNHYDAVFPAVECGTMVDYFFSAETTTGQQAVWPPSAPGSALSAFSATALEIALEDDFEADTGWTVGAAGDDATTGIWERGDPRGTAAQPGNDHTPDPATMCFFTGQGSPGGGLGENDVDNGRTTLVSPVIDLDGAADAIMSYWRWYSNDTGGSPNADVFVVDISNNNGSTWTNVETVGPGGPETGGQWFFHEFPVVDFVTPSAQMRVRFVASDEGSGSVVEAAVDDFSVRRIVCDPGIPGDLDGDGVVGILDLLILLTNWGPCPDPPDPCAADLDGDGNVGILDLLMLLSNWG